LPFSAGFSVGLSIWSILACKREPFYAGTAQCNSMLFQLFLNEFSKQNPEELKLMVLDNGAFHKAKRLVIPKMLF